MTTKVDNILSGIDSYRVTRMFGENPSQGKIQRMWEWRDKGLTYQQRKNNAPQAERLLEFNVVQLHSISLQIYMN